MLASAVRCLGFLVASVPSCTTSSTTSSSSSSSSFYSSTLPPPHSLSTPSSSLSSSSLPSSSIPPLNVSSPPLPPSSTSVASSSSAECSAENEFFALLEGDLHLISYYSISTMHDFILLCLSMCLSVRSMYAL
jgi:hypothetical protein